eukprot:g4035.t1
MIGTVGGIPRMYVQVGSAGLSSAYGDPLDNATTPALRSLAGISVNMARAPVSAPPMLSSARASSSSSFKLNPTPLQLLSPSSSSTTLNPAKQLFPPPMMPLSKLNIQSLPVNAKSPSTNTKSPPVMAQRNAFSPNSLLALKNTSLPNGPVAETNPLPSPGMMRVSVTLTFPFGLVLMGSTGVYVAALVPGESAALWNSARAGAASESNIELGDRIVAILDPIKTTHTQDWDGARLTKFLSHQSSHQLTFLIERQMPAWWVCSGCEVQVSLDSPSCPRCGRSQTENAAAVAEKSTAASLSSVRAPLPPHEPPPTRLFSGLASPDMAALPQPPPPRPVPPEQAEQGGPQAPPQPPPPQHMASPAGLPLPPPGPPPALRVTPTPEERHAVQQLVETENRHVANLQEMWDQFRVVVPQDTSGLSEEEDQLIFGPFRKVLDWAGRFYMDLENKASCLEDVANMLLQYTPIIKLTHNQLASDFEKVEEVIERIRNEKQRVAELWRMAEHEGVPLQTRLLQPLLHACTYIRRARALQSMSQPGRPEWAQIGVCIQALDSFSSSLSQRVTRLQQRQEIQELEARFDSNSLKERFLTPTRHLLLAGELLLLPARRQKKKPNGGAKPCLVMLFNDLFCWAKTSNNKKQGGWELLGRVPIDHSFSCQPLPDQAKEQWLGHKGKGAKGKVKDQAESLPTWAFYVFSVQSATLRPMLLQAQKEEGLKEWLHAFSRCGGQEAAAATNTQGAGPASPAPVSCTLCEQRFSFSRKRQQCKSCGNTVCAQCSKTRLVLEEKTTGKVRPSSNGKQRVCNACAEARQAKRSAAQLGITTLRKGGWTPSPAIRRSVSMSSLGPVTPSGLNMRAVSTREGFVLCRGWLLWRKRALLTASAQPEENGTSKPTTTTTSSSTSQVQWKRVFCVLRPTEISLYDREFDLNHDFDKEHSSVKEEEEEEDEQDIPDMPPEPDAPDIEESGRIIRRLPKSNQRPKLLGNIALTNTVVIKVPDETYFKPHCLEICKDAAKDSSPEVLRALQAEVRDNWLAFLTPCVNEVKDIKLYYQSHLVCRENLIVKQILGSEEISTISHVWKRRWVTLCSDGLHIYEQENQAHDVKKPMQSHRELAGAAVDEVDFEEFGKDWVFRVRLRSHGVATFMAESEQVRLLWLSKLAKSSREIAPTRPGSQKRQ